MALIVEDGSVVPLAECYNEVAELNTYHSSRVNSAWIGTIAVKEGAIRRAADYMIQRYRQRWKGTRVSADQVLDWPRGYVYTQPFLSGGIGPNPYLLSSTTIPPLVKQAECELALRALAGPLSPDVVQWVLSETIGPISTTYDHTAPQSPQYTSIDAMLTEFLTGSSNLMSKIVRT